MRRSSARLLAPDAALALALSLAAALAATPLAAEGGGAASFHAELDLFLGLKAGVECPLSGPWYLRGSAGICAISPLQWSYAAVAGRRVLGGEEGFQVELQAGLVQAILNVLEPSVDMDPKIDAPYAYWVPGLTASIGYRFRSGHRAALRAGAGCLLGYDRGAWQVPSFHPNLALEYGFRSPRRPTR